MPTMRISWALLLLFVSSYSSLIAQRPKQRNATEIHHELQKLNFLGTALYVAAHPDDENTRLISYLSNEVKAQTVYLSLTRVMVAKTSSVPNFASTWVCCAPKNC